MTEEKSSKTKASWSDLSVRAVSGVVLAVAAFAVTYWGGLAFALFFGAVSMLIYKEWVAIVGEQALGIPAVVGYLSILGALLCLWFGAWQAAIVIPLLGAGFLYFAKCSYRFARWCASGVLYSSAFGLSILALRFDDNLGFVAIIVVFALVWGTDVAAYFVGKSVGGPKLWQRVSPKKTWSGSVGGFVLGTGFALIVAHFLGISISIKLAALLGLLSILSQLGDLAESQMKRIFDVKDSSNLIPGHGGVMDRVDGLLVAVVAAAIVGLALGDIHSAATAFLIW